MSDFAIGNIVGSKWAQVGDEDGISKTLDYARIVPLLATGISTLSANVQELKRQVQQLQQAQGKRKSRA